MIRSLRLRILVAVSAIVVAAAAAVGLWSNAVVKREFDNFLVARKPRDHGAAAAAIQRHVAERGSLDGIGPTLAAIDAQSGFRTIVVDAAGRIVAAHPPYLRAARVEIDGRAQRIAISVKSGGRSEQFRLRGGGWSVRDRSGARVASVFLLPREDELPALRQTFRGSVNRGAIAVVAFAAAAAVLILFTIFRRLFAPMDALTAGARALAAGRLDTRVDVRGDDEIADLACAFNGMAEALERNDRARRNMVGDIAHELRTPLTNIRCEIEAVQDGLRTADGRFVASLDAEASALSRLVDDLQQLSLAEAGQVRLERQAVAASDVVTRAVSGLERLAEEKAIAIRVDADPSIVLDADPQRVVQVIRNLLSNALAHARTSIGISVARGENAAEISVADDGAGIPPEHLGRIFERFHRADPSRSRRTGGAGLGLAIAHELVSLHGGSIRAENSGGGGARFVVTLPLFIDSSSAVRTLP